MARKPEQKIPVEQLQEEFLQGPAEEAIEQVAAEMKENQIVVTNEIPKHEKVVFRNQRDPGYPLTFHYASKTHPFKQYTLVDGKEYLLPREVILNLEGCRENVEKYRKNSDGVPEIYVSGYKTHFVCERVA
jgi:uncharacterized protein YoaH (UPF0181 family)